jgi:hypothetical protein
LLRIAGAGRLILPEDIEDAREKVTADLAVHQDAIGSEG